MQAPFYPAAQLFWKYFIFAFLLKLVSVSWDIYTLKKIIGVGVSFFVLDLSN